MAKDNQVASQTSDEWSQWLLDRRHGGDPEYRERMRRVVERYRDRVLDGARLGPGMTLADIGTGEGLVALGAIARIGPTLRVILTDVSLPMLRHTEETAVRAGVRDQCTFIQGSADKLDGIADAAVDAVATRAVLAYVADKPSAFREFYRVLRPGGRLSIAEPIFQDEAFETCSLRKLVEAQPNHPNIAALRLFSRYRCAQYPSTPADVMKNPLTNYNERDLLRIAQEAGFANLHLELHIDVLPALKISWESHLDVARHPLVPTLREIMAGFSPDEATQFEQILRPIVEQGESLQKEVTAYLTAEKPGSQGAAK